MHATPIHNKIYSNTPGASGLCSPMKTSPTGYFVLIKQTASEAFYLIVKCWCQFWSIKKTKFSSTVLLMTPAYSIILKWMAWNRRNFPKVTSQCISQCTPLPLGGTETGRVELGKLRKTLRLQCGFS